MTSLRWNPTVLLLFLSAWPRLHSHLVADAASTSPPITHPRFTFITGLGAEYDEDYDEEGDSVSKRPPEVFATTRMKFLQRELCKFNPCLENQVPCAKLLAETGCLCPGISGVDQPPYPPRLHAMMPIHKGANRGKVEVKWCAPTSVVTQYRVVVERKDGKAIEFGEASRQGLVGSLEVGTKVCVEAVNKAGHSMPTEFSCMRYDPPSSSDYEVLGGIIGGGILLLLLILGVVVWRCYKNRSTKRDSADGLGNPSYSTEATMDVSYDDLKALMEKGQNLLLVDVRTQQEVDKGRIPGSLHIPVDEVQGAFGLEPEAFKAKYGVTKPPLNSSELVFHCQMGKRGATATTKANQHGYLNARNYAGGYKEWSERGGK
ncbi:LRRN4 C-terminal-like protein [Syngnathus typhle]|uniref:LRRN4 C-terminal-like protein n=1 Tax=Syngnathus typhle TaxID=161592 RepID=UPI002A69C640|nr:LRRN4 C-terminal-like protein [Syngnathus typhle]